MDYGNKMNNMGSMKGLSNMRPKQNANQDILAGQGRYGDTEVRNVGGIPSHVNAYEAYMIDNFGPAGEDFTRTMGSGTINPMTGMPEYAPKWLRKLRKFNKKHGINWKKPKLWGRNISRGLRHGVNEAWQWLTPSGHSKWLSNERSSTWNDVQDWKADIKAYRDRIRGDYERETGTSGEAWKKYQANRDLTKQNYRNVIRGERDKRRQVVDTSGLESVGSNNMINRDARLAYERKLDMDDMNYQADLFNRKRALYDQYQMYSGQVESNIRAAGAGKTGSSFSEYEDPYQDEMNRLFDMT